jgi:hypothetical protein
MYKSSRDTGYAEGNTERFQYLNKIAFDTVLDVGSGPCMLYDWLLSNDKICEYEAYDVRHDALEECKCITYQTLPNNKYDLVCLFGVYKLGIEEIQKEKQEFFDLLKNCKELSRRYLIYSVLKDTIPIKRAARYSIEDIHSMVKLLEINIVEITHTSDDTEYLVICEI